VAKSAEKESINIHAKFVFVPVVRVKNIHNNKNGWRRYFNSLAVAAYIIHIVMGTYFCRLAALKKYRVYTLFHLDPTNLGNSFSVDLSNSLGVFMQVLKEVEPNIVVHLAAMTNVDQCEIERDAADKVNHLSVKELVNYIINTKDCLLLNISTDYAFDGEKGNYVDADETNPINWYGMTKLLGEQELLECNSESWCCKNKYPIWSSRQKIEFSIVCCEKSIQRT
jgi:RmlD substrate binding domain